MFHDVSLTFGPVVLFLENHFCDHAREPHTHRCLLCQDDVFHNQHINVNQDLPLTKTLYADRDTWWHAARMPALQV